MKRHHVIFSGVLLAVFIVFALVKATDHPSSAPAGTCKFSSSSIGAIALGLGRQESSHEILSTTGFATLQQPCKFAVNNWAEHPDTAVRVSISGRPPQAITGNQIKALTPASTINPTRIERALACGKRYGTGSVDEQRCVAGAINP